MAEVLAARGNDVKVLTGFPNYPYGKILDGYQQRWSHREVRGDVTVRRVPLYASHDNNGLRRAANFLSFASSSSIEAPRFLADRDVIYSYATPATAAAAPFLTHALRGIPYVLHVLDLWPESVLESGMAGGRSLRPILNATLNTALGYLYRHAAHVIALAPTMKQTLISRGVPSNKVSVVMNPADFETPVALDPEVRARLGRPDRTLAVYAGNVGQMQDVETIVRAAAMCQGDVPIDVAIVGSGTKATAVRELARNLGTDNIRFFDRVDNSEMPAIYAASDYQLVTLKDRAVFKQTIPSKLACSLSAGCPIISTVSGDVADMCAAGGFGFSCGPEDPTALAELFRLASAESEEARRRKRQAALDYYWSNMSMGATVDSLETVLAGAMK
jgi:glycosyltransferase involved in cell wall biosynthesis